MIGRYRYIRIYKKSRGIWNNISKNSIIINEDKTADYLESMLKKFSSIDKYLYLLRYVNVINTLKGFEIDKNMKILDVGCGDGYLLEQIKENFTFNELYGIDISIRRLNLAKKRLGDGIFLNSEAEKLPFPDEYFDILLCVEVLEHLSNPLQCIVEMKRVLKSGGKIILTTPSIHIAFLGYNPLTWIESILSLYYPNILPPFHNLYEPDKTSTVIHRAFTIKEIASFFKDCSNVKYVTIISPHIRFLPARFIILLERFFRKIPVINKLGTTIFIEVTK